MEDNNAGTVPQDFLVRRDNLRSSTFVPAIWPATQPAGQVLLRVDDSGPGIPVLERERAFERFNRLGQTKIEGVGLGLSIVLSVVKLHDARIQLLDSPLGGLRVQVVLVAVPARQLQQPVPQATP